MKTPLLSVLFAAALLTVTSAHGAVVAFGSRASFVSTYPGASVETYDTYAVGTTIANGGTLNGITYSANNGISVITDSFVTSTGLNGLGRTPINYFQAGDEITFSFGVALSAFGIDINTFASTPGAYTLTTNTGDVINSVVDLFPGFGTGNFAGFSSTVSFTSVTLKAPSQEVFTLDTLRYVPAPVQGQVPDGGLSVTLLASALGALLAFRRKLA